MTAETVPTCRASGCGSPLAMQPPGKDGMCGECLGDGACPKSADGMHCDHWWDEEPCCACGWETGR